MGCPCSKKRPDKNADPIIDVQKAIEDWAWNHFITHSAGRFRKRCLRRSQFVVDVPMNYYLFEDSSTKLEDLSLDPSQKVTERTTTDVKDNHMDITDPNTSIISTKYVNDTAMAQVYKFRMERTRKATMRVSCLKGFSIGGDAKFSIGVGEIGANAKFDVTNTREQTFEQTVLFETASDINIQANTDCSAVVVFTKRESRKKFRLETTMKLSSDSAPIYIRRKKTNKVEALIKLTNLKNVFKTYEKPKKLELIKYTVRDHVGDLYNVHAVKLFTEGVIEGAQLSDQTVKLCAKDIKEKGGTEIGTVNEELKKHYNSHDPVDDVAETTF